jgi:hypothetical protein
MRQTVSDQYTATANIELREKGKHTITPPPPKRSALDKGPNSEARAGAQLRTNHWLSGVYLKRIKKRSHDGCWFCEPSHNSHDTPRMTRTHVLLRCVAFAEFRRETWTDPLTGEFTHLSSIGQLLGNPRWEKRLLKFLQRTKIGRIGPDLIDDEIRRVTRYEGWTDLVPDERLIDGGEQVADHILDTIVVRQYELATGLSAPISRSSGQVMLSGCLFFFFLFLCLCLFLFCLFVRLFSYCCLHIPSG